jgi:hypothetical protein
MIINWRQDLSSFADKWNPNSSTRPPSDAPSTLKYMFCDCGGVALVSTIEHALFCYYRSSTRRTAQWELVKKERKKDRQKQVLTVCNVSIHRVCFSLWNLPEIVIREPKKSSTLCTIGTDGSTDQDSYVPLPCSSCDSNWHLSICKQLGER